MTHRTARTRINITIVFNILLPHSDLDWSDYL
jgi:hypothetical protein